MDDERTPEIERDPFDPPAIPPGGARPLAIAGFVLGVAAVGLFALGIVGMVLGTLSHAKGDRLGLPSAVVSGVGTIAGMAVVFLLRA